MRKLGEGIKDIMGGLGSTGSDAKRRARRAMMVRSWWKSAVTSIYGKGSDYILSHTNEVYIVKGDEVDVKRFDRPSAGRRLGGRVLVVYSDDSMVRSDLDNRQEFIKLYFESVGEHIDEMDILPSKGDMKKRHPFKTSSERISYEVATFNEPEVHTGDAEEIRRAMEAIETVESESVKKALKNAISADLKR